MEFHEIANIFPMMQSDEYENLVADIKQNGLIEPIILYENKILDGRNRWKACIEAGVEPRFENYSGDSPISYVISKNANRRHLSKSQLAMIATEVLPMLEEEAEKRKIANLKQNKADVELVPHRSIGHSRDIAGEMLGVTGRYITEAKKIKTETPEFIEPILNGELTIPKATKLLKIEKAKEQFVKQTQTAKLKATIEFSDAIEWLNKMPPCDLLLTDPPYMTDVDDINLFANWIITGLNKVKDTGRAYVFIGAYPKEMKAYLNVNIPKHIELCQVLIWTYKNTLGNNPKDRYKQNYQACLYFKGINSPDLNCPITNEQWAVQEINAPDGRQGDRFQTWQKPLEIANRFIRHSTKEGDIIYDPFAGTGTFLLAAAELGRTAKGCDISENNLNIAIKRGCKYA